MQPILAVTFLFVLLSFAVHRSRSFQENSTCGVAFLKTYNQTILVKQNYSTEDDLVGAYIGPPEGMTIYSIDPEKCVVQICWSRIDSPFLSCDWVYRHYPVPPATFQYFYQLVSLRCGCWNENLCNDMTCPTMDKVAMWEDTICGVLFQDTDCRICAFGPQIRMVKQRWVSAKTFIAKSVFLRPGCQLRVRRVLDDDSLDEIYHESSNIKENTLQSYGCECHRDLHDEMYPSLRRKKEMLKQRNLTATSSTTALVSTSLAYSPTLPVATSKPNTTLNTTFPDTSAVCHAQTGSTNSRNSVDGIKDCKPSLQRRLKRILLKL